MATIAMHHVISSMAGIGDAPAVKRDLLVTAGINPDLVQRSRGRLHTDQVARLFRNVQLALDDEYMGFSRTPCPVGAFQTMCELVKGKRTLSELLETVIPFYRLINRDVDLSLTVVGAKAVFGITHHSPQLDGESFLREFLLVIWHRFPSWFIGEAIPLRETHFSFSCPDHRDELALMFPGTLVFDCSRDELVFDAHFLEKRLIRDQGEVDEYVRCAPADVMTIPGNSDNLERKILRLIESRRGESLCFPLFEEIAQELNMGRQTLYRSLKAAGSSYQGIKDDMRRETAISALIDDGLTVEEVSAIVGYRDARSFTRAFKQWTGMSPRVYKVNLAKARMGSIYPAAPN